MDPAETEKIKLAITSQGAHTRQHEQALREMMDTLNSLTTSVNQLGGRMDQVATQLTTLSTPIHVPAPPSAAMAPAPPPVSPATQSCIPCEPFIPTPAHYSGEPGSCRQFLRQCSLVFNQQPLTYSSASVKVAFTMGLLIDKASAWSVAVANSNSRVCLSFQAFSSEMLKVFDHSLQRKEVSNRLLSLRQGSGSVYRLLHSRSQERMERESTAGSVFPGA